MGWGYKSKIIKFTSLQIGNQGMEERLMEAMDQIKESMDQMKESIAIIDVKIEQEVARLWNLLSSH